MGSSAIVLLSGGLDSATVLAYATSLGHRVHALSFDYGQRHAAELVCARRQAAAASAVVHEVVDLSPLGRLVRSATALIRASDHEVPKGRIIDGASDIPITYVPARNTVFLAYALAWAEACGADAIFIGVNALDSSGYPDCRPEFIESFANVANLATRAGVTGQKIRIETPLITLRKHEIITLGVALGVDYANTLSCYDPEVDDDGHAWSCGACDSCQLRRRGFEDAGVVDPTRYRPDSLERGEPS